MLESRRDGCLNLPGRLSNAAGRVRRLIQYRVSRHTRVYPTMSP